MDINDSEINVFHNTRCDIVLFSSPKCEVRDRSFSEKRRKEKYERTVDGEKRSFLLKSSRAHTNLSYCAIDRFESFTSLRKPHCYKIRSPERIRAIHRIRIV